MQTLVDAAVIRRIWCWAGLCLGDGTGIRLLHVLTQLRLRQKAPGLSPLLVTEIGLVHPCSPPLDALIQIALTDIRTSTRLLDRLEPHPSPSPIQPIHPWAIVLMPLLVPPTHRGTTVLAHCEQVAFDCSLVGSLERHVLLGDAD